jgi:photosystem II stability/assembly factor-like uncharacterized protein
VTIDSSVEMGLLRPSGTGRYIYDVAVWLESGRMRRQIVRTPDLGASWCLVATAEPIAEVIPAPGKETDLYAVTAAVDPAQRQLLRTTDGGTTWNATAGAIPTENPFIQNQHVVVAADPDVVWISEPQLLHLTRDGGTTWTTLEPPELAGQPFVDPARPQRLFAPSLAEAAVYASTDWAATWTRIALPEFNNCNGNWPFSCGFSMDSSAVVYRGNAILGSTGTVNSVDVWRSTDWGVTWTQWMNVPSPLNGVPSTLGSQVPGALFVSTLDGTFGSADGGLHWKLATASNFWSLTAATARTLIGKSESSLVATTDGGDTWLPLPPVPNPTALAASPAAPYLVWTGPGPLRSDDGGVTWRASSPSNQPGVVVDGADGDVAYTTGITGVIITRTEDGGATWESFPSPTGRPVFFLAACPPPRSCLFALDTTPSAVAMVRSDDHGRTWRAPTPWTNWDTRSEVVVSPEDPDHLLQGRSDAVYETHDGGQTWNYRQLGFPVAGIAFLSDLDVIGISDQRRFVRSSDGGISWTVAADQPLLIPAPSSLLPRLVQSSRRPTFCSCCTGRPCSAATIRPRPGRRSLPLSTRSPTTPFLAR